MEGRYALIVANGGYRDPKLSRLRSPATDASELARVLQDEEIGAFEVELSADEPEHVLRRRVGRFFADRKRDDLLLLHFSCHGLKDDSGQLYFAAADTEVEHLEATAISAEFVSRQMTRSRSRKVVALLDCCYSGAIARGLQFRAGAEVDVEDHLGGHGRVVITASSAMEYAFEGDELSGEGKPSVFTTAVVRGLESGEADRDQDRLISVDDLYDYVCEQVREVTPHQRPNMLSHLEGALYIARSSYVAPVTPAPLPVPLLAAIDNPLAGVRGGAVGELAALLAQGDPGTVAAARAALTTLAGDDSRRVAAAAAEALGDAASSTSPPLSAAAAVEPIAESPVASAALPVKPDGGPPVASAAGPVKPAAAPVAERSVEKPAGRRIALAALALSVLGGLGVAVIAATSWGASYIGWAEIAVFLSGLIAVAAAFARHQSAGAKRRPALSAAIVLSGGFSLGAATAIAGLESNFGEGGAEGPVMLAATIVLIAGVLGVDRRAQAKPPRWAAAVAIPAAVLSLIGALLPWLYDASMHYQVEAPLEGTIWLAVGAGCVSAAIYAIPGLRVPITPALPLLAAGSFLLGAVIVIFNHGAINDYPWEVGAWLLAAGALATTVVATLLAVRQVSAATSL